MIKSRIKQLKYDYSIYNRKFLSFKEQSTLSLVASALKEIQVPAEDIIFNVGTSGLSLMKSAVVYGANASGKSNFIKALEFFKWYVINSSKDIQAGERVNIESFRLNSLTANEPSYFEAIFCDEDNQYRYGFEADNSLVHSEWLYQKANKKRAKEIELFYREKIILIFILSLSLVKNLQVNEW